MGRTMLICPHCGAPLVRKDKTFCCESGHSYDIARAGYCNLLQTNKPGDHTGDSKEMVEARRAFWIRDIMKDWQWRCASR